MGEVRWDLEFIVPRSLEQHDALSEEEEEEDSMEDYPTVVICSGELVEQVRFLCVYVN